LSHQQHNPGPAVYVFMKIHHDISASNEGSSTLPGVRLVHGRDLARNGRPLELAPERLAALLALKFLPFQEFVPSILLVENWRDGLRGAYEKRRCGWMMTFSRLARTKQYARGYDSPDSFITSAMQMVADRETPTRQCTKVAVPLRRPFSAKLLAEVFAWTRT